VQILDVVTTQKKKGARKREVGPRRKELKCTLRRYPVGACENMPPGREARAHGGGGRGLEARRKRKSRRHVTCNLKKIIPEGVLCRGWTEGHRSKPKSVGSARTLTYAEGMSVNIGGLKRSTTKTDEKEGGLAGRD